MSDGELLELKAIAFDMLMRAMNGNADLVRTFRREAKEQPNPDRIVKETVRVLEWRVRIDVAADTNDLERLLIAKARAIRAKQTPTTRDHHDL